MDENEIADIEPPTPEQLDAWKAALPEDVRKEIDAEATEQCAEMIEKFEAHALEYEKAHPDTAPQSQIE